MTFTYVLLLFSQTFNFHILTILLWVWICFFVMKCAEIWYIKAHFQSLKAPMEQNYRGGIRSESKKKRCFVHNLFAMSCWQGHVISCGCQQVSHNSRVSWRLTFSSSVHLTVTAFHCLSASYIHLQAFFPLWKFNIPFIGCDSFYDHFESNPRWLEQRLSGSLRPHLTALFFNTISLPETVVSLGLSMLSGVKCSERMAFVLL